MLRCWVLSCWVSRCGCCLCYIISFIWEGEVAPWLLVSVNTVTLSSVWCIDLSFSSTSSFQKLFNLFSDSPLGPIDHIRISCVCLSSVCFHPWFCVPPCRLGSPSVRFQYETERRFKLNVHNIICRAPSAKCEDYQTPPELGQTSSTWTHISVHTVLWATLSDLQMCGGEVEVERRNFCSAVLQRKF